MKKVNLSKSVYELVQEYPEIIDIMAGLGFSQIKKKAVLNSLGKIITIPKGAGIKNISMADIVAALYKNGFEIEGEMPAMASAKPDVKKPSAKPDSRKEQIKNYLKRLSAGETLDSVRADFVKEFKYVEASEIMAAEQELLSEGVPLTEVQRLCDVHSALFHGKTDSESTAAAEDALSDSTEKTQANAAAVENTQANGAVAKDAKGSTAPAEIPTADYTDKNAKAKVLENTIGHPLYMLSKENEVLTGLIEQYREQKTEELFSKIRDISIHYAKKGDLIYPLLKVKYGISGPSDVMWTVDDEIRDELRALAQESEQSDAYDTRMEAVLKRAEEMVYKEQNILFPISTVNFSKEEWFSIYHDLKDYGPCFGVEAEIWQEAEEFVPKKAEPLNGEISLPGGSMNLEQLRALLNTIPLEITFVDDNNINRFFNEGPKLFKRPSMAIGRNVFSCHPPKIEPMVKAIIESFRNGTRDSVPVWMNKNGKPMLVTYMAVRDENKKYLGTMELVQDMDFAREYFSK